MFLPGNAFGRVVQGRGKYAVGVGAVIGYKIVGGSCAADKSCFFSTGTVIRSTSSSHVSNNGCNTTLRSLISNS